MNNKKLIIIVVGAFVTIITMSGIVTYKMYKEEFSTNTVTNTEKQMIDDSTKDMTEEEKKNVNTDSIVQEKMGESYLRYSNAYKFGDKSLPEYTKEKSDTLYHNLIILAQSANYNSIISKIEEQKKQYKFYEDYNWKIGDLYLDANVMKSTQNENISDSQKGYMVKNLKDPNMLLIGTLMMPEKSRRDIIADKNSLTPIFKGAVSISNTETIQIKEIESVDTIEDFTLRTLIKQSEDLVAVKKIDFKVEGHALIAYLAEGESGAYNLYSIQKDNTISDDSFDFKTIAYYIELDNNKQ